jgi:AcrR family transcriptional regulator
VAIIAGEAAAAADAKPTTDSLTPRAQRTRAALLVSARTIFERDGYHAARITDIADGASVAHGTFYTYFDSKETIFLALVDDFLGDMFTSHSEPTGAKSSLDAYERLERTNREYLRTYRDNGRIIAIWEDLASDNAEAAKRLALGSDTFVARSERQIRRLQQEGRVDAELDPRYVSRALTSMVHRFAYSWFARGEEFDFETAVSQLTRLWANAIKLDQ